MKRFALMLCALTLPGLCADFAAQQPKHRDKETVDEYAAKSREGYNALEKKEFDTAVAAFQHQIELIPDSAGGYYNLACAYALMGKQDKGIASLRKAAEHGFHQPKRMEEDPDLERLRETKAFKQILERTRANERAYQTLIAKGLPKVETPAIKTESELRAWEQETKLEYRHNSAAWSLFEKILWRMDHTARKLAAQSVFEKENPGFNESFERLNGLASVGFAWAPWGSVSDAMAAEYERLLKTNPSAQHLSAANFFMGKGIIMKDFDWHKKASRDDVRATAISHLSRVTTGEYKGAALAWKLSLQVSEENPMKEELRSFYNNYRNDEKALMYAAMRMRNQVVEAIWPTEVTGKNLAGETVKLEDYAGKVVLLDFWATWCAPCIAEFPYMREAYAKFKDQGFEIISVSMDNLSQVPEKKMAAFMKRHKMNWKHIYEGDAFEGKLAKDLMVFIIPSPFLVGKNGELFSSGEGLRGEALLTTIKAAIND